MKDRSIRIGKGLTLSLGVMVALVGNGAAAAAAAGPLRLATFQADVTPPLGSPLCHGSVTPAMRIVDPLSARGVVLLGAGKPIVLCAVDWVGIGNTAHDEFRRRLAEAAGTEPDRVAVHVLHQHDAPGVDFLAAAILAEHGLDGAMFDPAVCRQAIERTAIAVKDSLGAAAPVTHIGCGQGRVERVASNRRILDENGRLLMTRMSAARDESRREAPEGVIDPDVRLVSFWNGDAPVASLTYYATHPQSHYGKGDVSHDFVGMARTERQRTQPTALHVHFDGAGGDIAAGKYNDGSPENRPLLAGRLARGMEAAWQAQHKKRITADDVTWTVERVSLPIRDTLDERALLETVGNGAVSRRDRIFAARELAWLRRMRSGHRIPLACLGVGPVRILHMPGELCIDYQLAAHKMAPEHFVAMAAYGDLGMGYICTARAYAQGGYETGFVSRVAPEVENVLMDAMRRLLETSCTRPWPALPEHDGAVEIPAQEWPLRPGPRTVRVSVHYPAKTLARVDHRTGIMLSLHNWGGTDCVGTADPGQLAERLNVVALCVNYLQSGKYEGPEPYDFGYLQALDALRAVHWVFAGLRDAGVPFAPGRIYATGGSGGGNVTLMANKLAPRTFACVIDMCGMKKLSDDIAFGLPGGSHLDARYSRDPNDRFFLSPDAQQLRFIGDPEHLAVIRRLGGSARIVTVHGVEDDVCPYADAVEMVDLMRRAGIAVEPWWIERKDVDGAVFTSAGHPLGNRTQIVFRVAEKHLLPAGEEAIVRRGPTDFERREDVCFPTENGRFVISYRDGFPVGRFEPVSR